VLIDFATDELRDNCNDTKSAKRAFGGDGAKRLRQRLDDLDSAANLELMRALPGKCHELKGDLAGCLSLRLDGGRRLVFRPAQDPPPGKPDGGLDWSLVTSITVMKIEDYHD
jgi:proteic killer suppression protein